MALACLAAEAEQAGDKLAQQGFALLDGSDVDRTAAVAAFDALCVAGGREVGSDDRGSARIAPGAPLIGTLMAQPAVRDLVAETLGPAARPVRAIAFDKTGHRNWFVPWHQDRAIAVKTRDDSAPARNWTVKDGVPHCEAPVSLLEGMLTLRWHLDLIGPADGGLRVLPGSHTKGRLTTEEIAVLAAETPAVELAVSAGTVLAMRPLLVHGSRRRTTRGHRRILHVELASGNPPPPLEWAWA
ncbi:phytanoyl-CoA dioxygenase family protein [Pelagibius sp. CAU 1746]|uniref:phytanoyl-CoA dioxygenase family protein n=1 Tax=Pelagibius sp. CAU 1746 TaxID=3140370 RepID=UPI00325AE901